MASFILRSIHRSVSWGCRKPRSANFVGSPMRTVSDQRPMSTVSDGIYSAAAAPWLMLPPSYEYGGNVFSKLFRLGGKMDYKFYSIADDKVISVSKRRSIGEDKLKLKSEREAVLVGSSHGWLALYKARRNLDLFLYNPLSHRYMKLPSVKTIPVAEEKLRSCWGRPIKVILSCSPDEEDGDLCRAIMSFGPRGNMAYCCPGRSTEWTPFGDHFYEIEKLKTRIVRDYRDFVYSATQKQLFCLAFHADFESWDLGDPTSPKLIWKTSEADMKYDKENYPWAARSEQEYELKHDLCKSYMHLVFAEHSNQLFLVRRHVMQHMDIDGSYVKPVDTGLFERSVVGDTIPYKTVGFDVHVIDREKGELVYMDGNLDGMSFFIGSKGHGFVVESPEKMKLKPNSIYFTDAQECTPAYWNKYKTYGGHDIGIFDYGNKTFSPCYYPCDTRKVQRIQPAPMWFTPSHPPSPS